MLEITKNEFERIKKIIEEYEGILEDKMNEEKPLTKRQYEIIRNFLNELEITIVFNR